MTIVGEYFIQGYEMKNSSFSQSKFMTVITVVSGNFIEMYDFFLFGFYAVSISDAFFPLQDDYASLMLTFATFGAGFLMRPLGAIFLGSYIDRLGRRKGLLLTLGIMASGTAIVAFTPSYKSIGLIAPLVVLVGRLLQGFSAGVELGGVSVYLSEIATPGLKGLFVSWQSASQQVAIIFCAALGYMMGQRYSESEINDWAWRIPFFIGCMIIPLVFYIRRSLQETEAFSKQKDHPSLKEILNSLQKNTLIITLGMMLIVMTTVSFYLITVYTPTFGQKVLEFSSLDSLVVTLCIGVSNFIWLPIMGLLSDKIGRWPSMLVFSLLALFTAYPCLNWLVNNSSLNNMLIIELWFSFIYSGYNGATTVALTEIIPVRIRTTGFSLAYSLATALFGGFTPLISTWLIEVFDDKAAPAYWMSTAGGLAAIATVLIYGSVIKTTFRERKGKFLG